MSPRHTLAASVLLLVSLGVAIWNEHRQVEPTAITPTLTGEEEYCVACHAAPGLVAKEQSGYTPRTGLPEISQAHPVQSFGCVTCHGGERLALDADLVHSTLRGGRNPSDFSVAEASCGGSDCHSGPSEEYRDHIHRALTSVQTTYAGAIAQIRFTYGDQTDLIAQFGVHAIQDDLITTTTGLPELEAFMPGDESASSVQAFAENCMNCHLSAEPMEGGEYARLTGCAACHTPSANTDLDQPLHQLTTAISYTQCNSCHNRGNYDLRDMQFKPRTDEPLDRLHDYYQPIAQFVRCEWTLDCIDCHTRQEAMGDGDIHSNKQEIQYVQCSTCHGTLDERPRTKVITDPEDLATRLALLNPVIDLQVGDTIIVTERGEPLWNTRLLPDGSFELFGKANEQRLTFRPVLGSNCQQKTDEQDSRYCHECHAVER